MPDYYKNIDTIFLGFNGLFDGSNYVRKATFFLAFFMTEWIVTACAVAIGVFSAIFSPTCDSYVSTVFGLLLSCAAMVSLLCCSDMPQVPSFTVWGMAVVIIQR